MTREWVRAEDIVTQRSGCWVDRERKDAMDDR